MIKTQEKRRRAKRGAAQKKAAFLFLLPGISGVSIFFLIPFAKVVVSSFCTALTGRFVGLRNYEAVFQNTAFRLAAGNTARFIGFGIPLLLIFSLLLALAVNSGRGRGNSRYLYLLPQAVPAATMVLVWKLLFAKQGLLNSALGTHIDFLEENSSFYILLGSYLWKNLGYTLVLWIAGLGAIPQDITEAARVDGAGRIRCFFSIILPNLRGSMYTILIVSLLNSFKVFREVYLVGGAYPHEKIYLLQHIFNNWYVNLDLDKMAAGAVLSVLVLGSISLLLQRLWDREEW